MSIAKRQTLLVLFAAPLFGACSNTPGRKPEVQTPGLPRSGDGLLITRIVLWDSRSTSMIEPQAHITIVAGDGDAAVSTLIPTPVGESLHALSLPPGKYSLSTLQMGSDSVRFWRVPSFRIHPNAACYIGDLLISIRANSQMIHLRVQDDQEGAQRRMQAQFPVAAAALPFVVELVSESTDSK